MMTDYRPARMHWLGGTLCLAVLGLIQGCSLYPPLSVQELSAATQSVLVPDVPFFPQTEFQCGPAALAGVLGAAGVDTTPDNLAPQVYLPGRHGSLQLELIAATGRAGLLPYVLDGEPAALVGEIESGRPVLVFHNLRTRHFPAWQFSVLLGFDPADNEFIFNSGVDSSVTMNARTFLRTWNWAGRWALVALKPGTLPSKAVPGDIWKQLRILNPWLAAMRPSLHGKRRLDNGLLIPGRTWLWETQTTPQATCPAQCSSIARGFLWTRQMRL